MTTTDTTDTTTTTSTTGTAGTADDTTTIVDRYLAAYGEPDGARRRDLIAATFTADATVADPPIDGSGLDGIDEMFVAVQAHFPNHTFRRCSVVDEHHSAARYEWELVADDGTISLTGTDFARFTDDGLITSIVGFLGPIAR